MLVTHVCNPSYSGGRDHEDCGSKPARGNSSQDPISKKPFIKTGLVGWLKVEALSSNPSTAKKREKPVTDSQICLTGSLPNAAQRPRETPFLGLDFLRPAWAEYSM
jgi:hypothetical protein